MKAPEEKPAAPERRRFSLFPQSLSRSLEPILKPLCKKHGLENFRILTDWESIVGPELAAWCLPQKLTFPRGHKDQGTVHLQVAGARALELQHQEPVIIDRINAYFGHAAVARLKFLPASAPFRREKKKPGTARREGAEFSALVEACDDEGLRGALLALATTLHAKR